MASVRKRNNTYLVEVFKGRDINGKRLVECATFKPDETKTPRQNQKALDDFVRDFEKKVKDGTSRGDALTFKQYADEWIVTYGAELEATTRTKYIDTLKNQLYPRCGHMKLSEIRKTQVRGILDDLRRTGYERNGIHRDYSEATIQSARRALSTILSAAVEDGLILFNPCLGRMRHHKKEIAPQQVKAFSLDEAMRFLEVLDMDIPIVNDERTVIRRGKPVKISAHINRYMRVSLRYKTLYTVTLFSGSRRGEMIGITWENVDFQENKISITQAAAYTPTTGMYIKTPKSAAGYREIFLPAAVMDDLKTLKHEMHKNIMKYGTAWKGSRDIEKCYVFANETGEMMQGNAPRRELDRILKAYNKAYPEKALPLLSFHQLRHTSASLLIANGIDPVAAAHRLGHSNAAVTLKIYAHSFAEKDKAASDVLETALQKRA